MIGNFLTVEEFIKDFRHHIGDTTCSVPEQSIIAWTNTTLRRLAREAGCDKLFRFQNTFRLSPMNNDGSPAASWFLRGVSVDDGPAPRIGTIINVESIKFLTNNNCPQIKSICYMPPLDFDRAYPMPETDNCGQPKNFTINQFGGDTQIIFSCPINTNYNVSMTYTAYHPRLTSTKDLIRIPESYTDVLLEGVKILQLEESSDFASARALIEDWDYYVSQLRESLARRGDGLSLRKLKGSF